MTPDQRRNLALQIIDNPLYQEVLDSMEANAIERLVYEQDNMAEAQLRVQAIRQFKSALEQCLEGRDRKVAPA